MPKKETKSTSINIEDITHIKDPSELTELDVLYSCDVPENYIFHYQGNGHKFRLVFYPKSEDCSYDVILSSDKYGFAK